MQNANIEQQFSTFVIIIMITSLIHFLLCYWNLQFSRYVFLFVNNSYISLVVTLINICNKKCQVLLLMIESCKLWTLKPKLWTSQIWTLIHLVNNFVIVLLCVKSSKLITLEENIISVQQLPVCLPLFFVFSSEVLNSGIKSCFDGVVFQDVVCEECLVYVFGVFTFSVFCYCFYEGFIPKIILVNWLLLFICIS